MNWKAAIVSPFVGSSWLEVAALVVVFYVGFCVAVLAHELAHYAAARAFSIVPQTVHVGHSGPEVSFSFQGTQFVLRLFANPLGTAATGFGEGGTSYAGAIMILMAGILVNFLMGAALVLLGIQLQSAIVLVLALASVSVGLGQIAPIGGTDGALLLRLLLGKFP